MTTPSDRWRTACHEAGHAVAGSELGGRISGLALTENGGGLAGIQGLTGDRHCFMTAAGPAAEYLAAEYDAPELPTAEPTPPEPVTADDPPTRFAFNVARYGTHPEQYQTDDRVIAEWAISGRESEPESWAKRVAFAKHVASDIIEKNVGTVMRVATELYIRGRLTRVEIETLLKGA